MNLKALIIVFVLAFLGDIMESPCAGKIASDFENPTVGVSYHAMPLYCY